MHYKQVKGILSAKNGMNLYRGCSHGCIYCDSRSKCYQFDHEFEDIQIKSNALELLEQALKSKRKKCMVGMGAMTDPYIHLEKKLQHTKKALELISKYNFGATLITKSDLVLRDLNLFKEINDKTKSVLQVTLTCFDDNICKIIEPNVALTSQRMKVLQECKKLKIPTVVWLTPLLPYITDTLDNLKNLLQVCKDNDVKGIIYFGGGMTLREGNREYYYAKLDKHFSGLKEEYIKEFGNNYILTSKNSKVLDDYFISFTNENNIINSPDKVFKYLNEFEEKTNIQLSMF